MEQQPMNLHCRHFACNSDVGGYLDHTLRNAFYNRCQIFPSPDSLGFSCAGRRIFMAEEFFSFLQGKKKKQASASKVKREVEQ